MPLRDEVRGGAADARQEDREVDRDDEDGEDSTSTEGADLARSTNPGRDGDSEVVESPDFCGVRKGQAEAGGGATLD